MRTDFSGRLDALGDRMDRVGGSTEEVLKLFIEINRRLEERTRKGRSAA